MIKVDRSYRRLQRQLNRQAVGFPATVTGADIRLLKTIFTPREAAVAAYLTYRPASLQEICSRMEQGDFIARETEELLDTMARNGAVGMKTIDGKRHYWCTPLVVGMYEGQVKRLTPEFREAFSDYTGTLPFGISWILPVRSQMRTIPVGEMVTGSGGLAPVHDADALLESHPGPFVLLECICRKKKVLEGESCQVTDRDESCLAMGDLARQCLEMKAGREVTRSEARDSLEASRKEGLVLQPSNSAEPEFICSCCGCCCGMINVQKMLPRPVDFWTTAFYARLDEETCTTCRRCVKKCQVDAIVYHEKKNIVTIDEKRCIGCGYCVEACPEEAIALLKSEDHDQVSETMEELYETLMKEKKGFWKSFFVVVKFLLQIKQ